MNIPDASVRDLPGDGLEPTPEFDTDSRQRDPIGPQQLGKTIDQIRNGGTPTPGQPSPNAPDASPGTATDAGAP